MWSYDVVLSTPKDNIRFLIGDVIEDDQLLSDEEINAIYESSNNVYLAASICCEHIAAKFARDADYSIGLTKITANQRYKSYTELAQRLRKKYSASCVAFDVTPVAPIFSTDMMSNK